MERKEKLAAYGFNLLGSLGGVLLMFLVSAFWTPPAVWFLIGFSVLLLFHVRKRSVFAVGAGAAVVALIILELPLNPAWQRIYSPYQLLEVGRGGGGLMEIRAAGHYYQKVYDLLNVSGTAAQDPWVQKARNYYDTPYRLVDHPKDVAVVGAGSGNDVAAALRSGAEHV